MKVAVNSKGNTSIGSAWHTAVTPHCLVEVTTICGQCPCHKVVSAAHTVLAHIGGRRHTYKLFTQREADEGEYVINGEGVEECGVGDIADACATSRMHV